MNDKVLEKILAVERACYGEPWDAAFFQFLFNNRRTQMIAVSPTPFNPKIVGFLVYVVYPNKTCVLNVAVLPEYRRRGYARKMLAAISRRPGDWMHAWVRETNLTAQLFFRSMGFGAVLEAGPDGESIGMEFTRYCDPEECYVRSTHAYV